MPLIPYPDVPPLPGVPAINRSSAGYVAAALTVVGELLPNNLFGSKWKILNAKTGQPILKPDNFLVFENITEAKVLNYPIEPNSFSTYNKVRVPEQYRLTVTCSGNGEMTKAQFLVGIDQMMTGSYSNGQLVLVNIVTPEYTSPNLSLIHTNNRREARNGATLLIFELFFQEVIQVPSTTVSTVQPSGASRSSFGNLSPTTPSSNFGSFSANTANGIGIH